MVVTIEFFGIHRDITKTNKVNMPITEKSIVQDVIEYIKDKYPALYLDKSSVSVAVNSELAPPDRLLGANDIIHILPPIGGG